MNRKAMVANCPETDKANIKLIELKKGNFQTFTLFDGCTYLCLDAKAAIVT